ncbi:MAG: DUF6111 family protein [Beijerinckiaceae bacterium]|jgi:UDP-N-acetylmuramyl pentapeptide phosphotransferase/UDP-N-acetylglucosamine-1-phosphate transferase|nr:DUF6111 family protein [Beijerinckiaceae bacterium]
MGRILFEIGGFFFVPFVAYAAFLMWQGRHPQAAKQMFERKALLVQTLIGLVLMALVVLFIGFTDETRKGAYRPAIFKDGQLVPGTIE